MKHPVVTAITALHPDFMKGIGATNAQIVSPRSLRFDTQAPGKDGVNRIKVTAEQGKLRVTFYRIEEVEMLYDLPPENLQTAIQAVYGKGAPQA